VILTLKDNAKEEPIRFTHHPPGGGFFEIKSPGRLERYQKRPPPSRGAVRSHGSDLADCARGIQEEQTTGRPASEDKKIKTARVDIRQLFVVNRAYLLSEVGPYGDRL